MNSSSTTVASRDSAADSTMACLASWNSGMREKDRGCRLPRIFGELVLEGVDEGEPARFDDVLRDADGAPHGFVVLAFDHDPYACRSASPRVDDADLVVDELHLAESRKVAFERFAKRTVEGIDRAIAFADGMLDLLAGAN